MHKAIAYHRRPSATGSNVSSSTLVGPGTWSSVGLPPSPYVYDPAFKRPITADSRPDPSWTSHDYACFYQARTGSYPTGNVFSRESAARFEDRAQSLVTTSDGSEDEMGQDEGEDEEAERRHSRVNYESEDDRYDRDERYEQRRDEDSADDAESSNESESNFEANRPRAAMSDVRHRHPQDSNTRVKEYASRLVRAAPPPPRMTYSSDDISSRLPPSVRIVRASASIISSRASEPESSTCDDEYTPNSASTSTSLIDSPDDSAPATSHYRTPRPARAAPPPKRKFSTDISDDDGSGPSKAPRLPKNGNPDKKGKRQYKCDICPNFFAGSKGDLKRHSESLVHKPPSYVCEMPPCGKKFTRLDALKRHMKNAHAPGKQAVKVFKNGHPKALKLAMGSK